MIAECSSPNVPDQGEESRYDDESHHNVHQIKDDQVHSICRDGALVPVALDQAARRTL